MVTMPEGKTLGFKRDLLSPKPKIIEIGMRVRFTVHLAKLLVLPPETESSRNQVSVQLPAQSDSPVQKLLLAFKDVEKSSGALRSVL